MVRICENCGKQYKQCKSCEERYSKHYYTWRTHFCSPKCMMEANPLLEERRSAMNVQYKKKMYKLTSFDLEKDQFVMPDGTKLKCKDIDGFVLPQEEMKKVIDKFKPVKSTRTTTKKEEKGE